jgi:hypothetical protein
MKYTRVFNPRWANSEHSQINCDVDFDDLSDELVPFTAVAEGDYEHSHQIFSECVAGKYGEIAEYVAPPVPEYVPPPEPTKEELMAEIQALMAKVESLS